MKPGKPLERRTPLQAKAPMSRSWWPRRREPSDPALPKQRPSKMGKPIPLSVRRALAARSGGVCERCGCQPAVHAHHRQKRSQGGEHTVANLVHLCVVCHDAVHRAGESAYRTGWLVPRGVDPATVTAVPLGERVR